jgi:UDP-arabinose 4-epimerase
MSEPQFVLVTGGAGYVGAHACKALARSGYLPVCVDNLSRGFRQLVKFGPFEHGDVRDAVFLKQIFARYRPIGVMHFAGLAYVQESVQDPAPYWENNVAGTLVLLNTLRQFGLPPLVFSSTCAVYGSVSGAVDERAELKPESPYGESKVMAERMIASFSQAYGLNAVALRYFNVAGADPDGDIGELHDPEPHVLPRLLQAANLPGDAFVVHGNDYATPDGSCVRDFIHVSDLAQAHVLALQKLLVGAPLDPALNLGNECGVSVLDLLKVAGRVLGRTIAHRIGARRPGDAASIYANAARARAQLNWHCEFPHLDAMVQSAWTWMRKQPHAIRTDGASP